MKVDDQQQDFSGGMVDYVAADRIPANAYKFAENFECRDGILKTRRGQAELYAGIEPGALGPWVPAGSCRYVTELGIEYLVYALVGNADGTLKTIIANTFLATYAEITFPAGAVIKPLGITVSADDAVTICQYGRCLYMFRRNLETVFKFDGNMDTLEWSVVPTADPGGGAEWVPPAAAACVAYGRVWLATKSAADDDVFDCVSASDITMLTDNLAWDQVAHHWQIGAGDHSDIMAMVPLSGGKIAVFKRHSTYVLAGCEGYIEGVYSETIDSKHGAVGGGAAVQVGADVWYLSDDGVRSVATDASNNARAVEIPVSRPIEKFFRDNIYIESTRRFQCRAAVYDSYVLFTVPYGASVPNALLAYDLISNCWAGIWSGMHVQQMQVVSGDTERALLGVDTNGAVQRLLTDGRWGQEDAPTAQLVMRAFNCGSTERRKSFRGGLIGVASGGAVYSLSALNIDTQEETLILTNATVQSDGWALIIPDEGITIPDEGIYLGDVSMSRQKFFAGVQARGICFCVRVESGALDIRSIAVEASRGRIMSEF